MRTIDELIGAVRREAERADFPVDKAVYEQAKKDPLGPILFAGSLDAPVAVLARDLGRDEVAAGQPLIGAGGRLVRAGFYQAVHGRPAPAADRALTSVLDRVLLTNTVPYKPPGNKAYSNAVKERFRPFVAELLAVYWRGGDRVITLGTEAFQWFAPYAADPGAWDAFWRREDRYEAAIACTLVARDGDGRATASKTVTVLPLPHPSPLNQRWYPLFPGLLARRLAEAPPSGS
jgi:uracil-DNA glycosylase